MPTWEARFDPARSCAWRIYVHEMGGGEPDALAAPAAARDAASERDAARSQHSRWARSRSFRANRHATDEHAIDARAVNSKAARALYKKREQIYPEARARALPHAQMGGDDRAARRSIT